MVIAHAMRKLVTSVTWLVLAGGLTVVGCAGKTPAGIDGTDSAAEPDAPDVVDPPADLAQQVSGTAKDYTGADPLADSTITTEGIDPAAMATAGTSGAFTFAAIPTGSKIFLNLARTGYRTTRNVVTSVEGVDVTQDVYALATTFVNSQYNLLGKTPRAGTAVVFADLAKNNGTPLVDVPLSGITLVGAADDVAVPGVLGPFVLDGLGQISLAATVTELHNASSRIAFLDVPAGTAAIKITYATGGGAPMTVRAQVTTTATGATLAHVQGAAGGGGGGGGGNLTDPKFATEIYPRLQKASAGGLGCANCHTAGGPAAILPYDGTIVATLAAIKAAPGVIDLTTPAASLLLTKPLYEPTGPQNHPNATFLNVDDPDYKVLLTWITLGTKP